MCATTRKATSDRNNRRPCTVVITMHSTGGALHNETSTTAGGMLNREKPLQHPSRRKEKISGSDFKIRATNFKIQGTYFLPRKTRMPRRFRRMLKFSITIVKSPSSRPHRTKAQPPPHTHRARRRILYLHIIILYMQTAQPHRPPVITAVKAGRYLCSRA